jgi:hypothetical protein
MGLGRVFGGERMSEKITEEELFAYVRMFMGQNSLEDLEIKMQYNIGGDQFKYTIRKKTIYLPL